MTVILCSHKWCQLSVCHHHFVGSLSVHQLHCQDPLLVSSANICLIAQHALLRISLSSDSKQPVLITRLQAAPKTGGLEKGVTNFGKGFITSKSKENKFNEGMFYNFQVFVCPFITCLAKKIHNSVLNNDVLMIIIDIQL